MAILLLALVLAGVPFSSQNVGEPACERIPSTVSNILNESQCLAFSSLFQAVNVLDQFGKLNPINSIIQAEEGDPTFDCFQNIFEDPCEAAYQFMLCYNQKVGLPNPIPEDLPGGGGSNIFANIINYVYGVLASIVNIVLSVFGVVYNLF